MELIFSIVSLSVMPFWLLLVLAPKHALTQKLVHVALVPLVLGGAYLTFMVLGTIQGAPEGAGFSSIAALRAAFSSDYSLLAGWTHYLAFDLFVGAWICRDAIKRDINHFAVIPCLLLTFMAGPVGLLLYILIRGTTRGAWGLEEIA